MGNRIWSREWLVGELNALNGATIHEALGIEFSEIGDDYLVAEMPVDGRTKQPFGLLHGGASVVLAESLGSAASYMVAGEDSQVLGLEVNANHLRAVREGKVSGWASPISLGKTVHVWEVKINDESGALSCIARLTVLVRERQR